MENPFTEQVIARVPASDEPDVNNAVEAAREAFESWRKLTAGERRDYMRALAAKSREHAPELAKIISAEMGKPFSNAIGEIEDVAEYLEYYRMQDYLEKYLVLRGEIIPISYQIRYIISLYHRYPIRIRSRYKKCETFSRRKI